MLAIEPPQDLCKKRIRPVRSGGEPRLLEAAIADLYVFSWLKSLYFSCTDGGNTGLLLLLLNSMKGVVLSFAGAASALLHTLVEQELPINRSGILTAPINWLFPPIITAMGRSVFVQFLSALKQTPEAKKCLMEICRR